jgi:hypothetical protein
MTDDEARALLAGVDAPRPLPPSLRRELDDIIAADGPLLVTDTARPLPDDLRRRLEATLITAGPRPVPRAVRRRILRATADRLPALTRAAAVLVLLVGAVAVLARVDGVDSGDRADRTASPATSPTSETSTTDVSADAAPGNATRNSHGVVLEKGVLGDEESPAVLAFNAYVSPAGVRQFAGKAAGTAAQADRGARDVTVNLAPAPLAEGATGIVFETTFVRVADLTDGAVSVGLPVEEQARLAVAKAYPEEGSGRAVVVVSAGEPWASAGRAFESALRRRGVEPRRVRYTSGAPRGAPAVFLALSPADARTYLGAHPTAPSRGIHAIASAYDDWLAQAGLTVVSPFAPPGGAEEARLRAVVPGGRLTAEAVHGWVTAKVVDELLRRTGGAPPTAADLAALDGWSPGWGVVVGRPGAYRLGVEGGRFLTAGRFLPASPDR